MFLTFNVPWRKGQSAGSPQGRIRGPIATPKRAVPRRVFAARLEALEDRTVLSTLTVTSAADDGSSGTLRSVIASAAAGDTITFASALKGNTITLTQGELDIAQSLDIEGPGAALHSHEG